jgi:hypothetical protein
MPVIREGLICPECKQLFPSVELLKHHYDERHKDRLRRSFSSDSILDKSSSMMSEKRSVVWPSQSLGATRALWERFAAIRHECRTLGRHVHPEILVRLSHLLYGDRHGMPESRFEQTVVPWAPQDKCAQCSSCGREFAARSDLKLFVGKTQSFSYHCRLCGCCVCGSCVHPLPLARVAELLTLFNARRTLKMDMYGATDAAFHVVDQRHNHRRARGTARRTGSGGMAGGARVAHAHDGENRRASTSGRGRSNSNSSGGGGGGAGGGSAGAGGHDAAHVSDGSAGSANSGSDTDFDDYTDAATDGTSTDTDGTDTDGSNSAPRYRPIRARGSGGRPASGGGGGAYRSPRVHDEEENSSSSSSSDDDDGNAKGLRVSDAERQLAIIQNMKPRAPKRATPVQVCPTCK